MLQGGASRRCSVTERLSSDDLDLFQLFSCISANDAEIYIRGRTLQSEHLIRVVNAAHFGRAGSLQVRNLAISLHGDKIAADLAEVSQKAPKSARRIRKLASKLRNADRQHILFFTIAGQDVWWTITYNLRDIEEIGEGHWTAGPHVHHSSYLFHPNMTALEMEERVSSGDKSVVPHGEHILFEGYIGQDIRF